MAGEVVVPERHERCRQQVEREDDLAAAGRRIREGAARKYSSSTSIIRVATRSGRKQPSRCPVDYTFAMFPVSDVIPSGRRPFVTVGLIVLNALVVPLRASAVPPGTAAVRSSLRRRPGLISLADPRHEHVPARRLDAPARQHALPLDLRRQRRGSARPLRVSWSSISAAAAPPRIGTGRGQRRIHDPDDWRQRRDRRRHGRVFRALSRTRAC